MKFRENKKGDEGFSTVIKLILGVIFLLIAGSIMWYLFTGQSILDSIFQPYIESNLTTNAYFQAEYVKIVNVEELKTKWNCDEIKKGVVFENCKKGTEVEIAVGIKNTGINAIPVYARPRIGRDCKDNGACKGETFQDGQKRCVVYDSKKIEECSIGYKYIFDDDGEDFRIYPGAYMMAQDYVDLTKEITTTNKAVYNKNSWIDLSTD